MQNWTGVDRSEVKSAPESIRWKIFHANILALSMIVATPITATQFAHIRKILPLDHEVT